MTSYFELIFILVFLGIVVWFVKKRFAQGVVLIAGILPVYLWRINILGLPTNLFELVVITVFLVGVCQAEVRVKWALALRSLPRGVVFFSWLFVAGAVGGVLVSDNLHTSLGVLKGWIVVPMLAGLMVFVIVRTEEKYREKENILRALMLSGVVVSVIGLFQIGSIERVKSVYDVPNSLALFIVPLIIITFQNFREGKKKIMNLGSASIMFGALLATRSAAGLFTVLVVILIGFLINRSKSKTSFLMLAGAMFVSLVFLAADGRIGYLVQPLVNKETYNSISVRRQLWDVGWDLIKGSPLLGIGLGDFEPHYQEKLHERFRVYQSCADLDRCERPIPEFVFRDPHNWVTSFWLNTGLLGLIGFSGLNIRVILGGNWQDKEAGAAAWLALVAILIFGLVDTVYWKNDLAVQYWLLVAILLPEKLLFKN